MAAALTRLVVDCSVVVKWQIPTEDHAAAFVLCDVTALADRAFAIAHQHQ